MKMAFDSGKVLLNEACFLSKTKFSSLGSQPASHFEGMSLAQLEDGIVAIELEVQAKEKAVSLGGVSIREYKDVTWEEEEDYGCCYVGIHKLVNPLSYPGLAEVSSGAFN